MLSTDPKIRKHRRKIRELVKKGEELNSRMFERSIWGSAEIKDLLHSYQSGKCCYCEVTRRMKMESDVEHFRPKSEIRDELKPGYWWLAYSWNNFFFSCKQCNTSKSSYFPLHGGTRAMSARDKLEDEFPVIPNPELEDPEEFIGWKFEKPFVIAHGKDSEGRGEKAVKLLGLNSYQLPEERGKLLTELERIARLTKLARDKADSDALQDLEDIIKAKTRSTAEFAGFIRSFFRKQGLGAQVSSN